MNEVIAYGASFALSFVITFLLFRFFYYTVSERNHGFKIVGDKVYLLDESRTYTVLWKLKKGKLFEGDELVAEIPFEVIRNEKKYTREVRKLLKERGKI